MKELKSKIEYVLEDYAAFVKEHGRLPSGNELKDEFSITRKTVEHHFGNYERLMRAALKEHPKAFQGVFLPEDFGKDRFETLTKEIKKFKRFVITTAVTGQTVFKPGLDALKNYCKKRNAKLLILPLGKELTQLDSVLKGLGIITKPLHLNDNIKLAPVRLSEKTVRPTSGLSRLGARSCSTIYPAPKLTKESVATDISKFPHLIITPGAVTVGTYAENGDTKMIKKADYIAEADHDLSAVIVEIQDDTFFFQRELQIDIDGSVVDVDFKKKGAFRYHSNGKVTKETALNLNCGDWHSGETAESAWRALPEIAKLTGAKTVSLHDVYSYSGRSHHSAGNKVLEAQMAESGMTDTVSELEGLSIDLQMWLKKTKADIYIVGSNHPEHLNKAVAEGLMDQPETYRTWLELSLAMMQGHDPVQWGLKHYAGFSSKRVTFLSRDDRHVLKNKFGSLGLHYHGDKGSNGSRGFQSLAVALGCAIVGHSHSPAIYAGSGLNGGLFVNGTSTPCNGPDRPEYSKGSASSWLQTSTLVYGSTNGRFLRQQITLLSGGVWTIDQKQKAQSLEKVPDIRAKIHTIRHHKNAIKRIRGLNTAKGPVIKVARE